MILFSSCKEDEIDTPVFNENYGEGMYIITDIGVSFYDNTDSLAVVQNQIFKSVNNTTIINPKKIRFNGTKAYIIADNYILTANVNTFENKEEINGFSNPVYIDFISHKRIFVVDKGDSKVKAVDLTSLDITSQIEAGDSTQPVFIVSNSYKSFVLNGGGLSTQVKDSTVMVIEYRDNLVQLADLTGVLPVGDNPNSAVFSGNLKVLCQGIYDSINSINNTESSLSNINQYSNQVYSTDILSGIYNARNLVSNKSASVLFFTASNGIYTMNPNGVGVSQIDPIVSDILFVQSEQYNLTDSTTAISNMLYVNDAYNSPNTIYKYNLVLSSYVDTIIVDGNVRDINFY